MKKQQEQWSWEMHKIIGKEAEEIMTVFIGSLC
jgi:hypothetical protein